MCVTSTPRIVLVDDEPGLVKFVAENLRARGYDVTDACDGPDGVALVRSSKPDLVILDINLPGMDGLEACGCIRSFSDVPIIMLTASGLQGDKFRALDVGADDYLTKPFGIGELMARVRVVLRRVAGTQLPGSGPEPVQIDGLAINFGRRLVMRDGEEIKLTPLEFSLLEQLATHPDAVWGHRDLISAMWGSEHHDETEYLRVYVGRLRAKLERDPAKPRYIVTIPGVGYRFATAGAAPMA